MIRFRKYKSIHTQAKHWGWCLEKFENTHTLDFYFGQHVWAIIWNRH